MEIIDITSEKQVTGGWLFMVKVNDENSSTEHAVTVDESYWKKLTGKTMPPAKLVKKSFEFLLDNEPKESILSTFDLSVISKYFPEYEEKIKQPA